MDQQKNNRSLLTESPEGIEIIITAKRNIYYVIFLCIWLCGWLMGEVFALGAIIFKGTDGIIVLWLIAWSLGGFFCIQVIAWILMGKEIINIGHGELSIYRKGMFLARPRIYDLNKVRDIHTRPYTGYYFYSLRSQLPLKAQCTICFNYEFYTSAFANKVEEEESKYILSKLISKGLLTDKNIISQEGE